MARRLLKILNSLIDLVIILALLLAGSYSAYALWDNNQVYTAAENVQAEMRKLKPEPAAGEDGGASFEELLKINPDVCAWLTLDDTNVDYPVLQGTDNLSYINTDVYGDFALAGSIYLDSRNSKDFQDTYSLLYGHHMEGGKMFGDLDLYKEETFFRDNASGMLVLPDRTYELEIIACMVVPASDKMIFDPVRWQADIDELADYIEENALHVRAPLLEQLRTSEGIQILSMSTCAAEFTDARTIVLAVMKPYSPER